MSLADEIYYWLDSAQGWCLRDDVAVKISLMLFGWGMIVLAVYALGLEQSISLALTEYFSFASLNIVFTALLLDIFAKNKSAVKNHHPTKYKPQAINFAG